MVLTKSSRPLGRAAWVRCIARGTRVSTIKILPHHLSDDATRRQRFEREAKVVSSLNHSHICTLDDVGRQDGVDFIVMEFLEANRWRSG